MHPATCADSRWHVHKVLCNNGCGTARANRNCWDMQSLHVIAALVWLIAAKCCLLLGYTNSSDGLCRPSE